MAAGADTGPPSIVVDHGLELRPSTPVLSGLRLHEPAEQGARLISGARGKVRSTALFNPICPS